MAAGSYAFSAMNISRLINLYFHAVWILGVLGITITLIMDFAPRWVAGWFNLTDESMISKWKETVPRYWSSTALMAWTYLGTTLLQVTNKPGIGLACALIGQVFIFPLVSTLWYQLSTDPASLFWSGLSNDTTAWVLTVAFDIPTFIELWRRRKEGARMFHSIVEQDIFSGHLTDK
jgi:Na+-driven multidrug efflux pump